MPLKQKNIYSFLFVLAVIAILSFVIKTFAFRIDLTEDKRYSLSKASRQVLENIEDVVFFRIYLDGEMSIPMKKFKTSIQEKLDELKRYSGKNIQYEFRNPNEGSEEKRKTVHDNLTNSGLIPLYERDGDAEGGATLRIIFPGALVSYKEKTLAVNLIHNNDVLSKEENLNFALQNLEYEIVNEIQKITRENEVKIAFIEGHGELDDLSLAGVYFALGEYYKVEGVKIDSTIGILDEYKAVIIAKPMNRWTEADKLVLDQYIMNGGRTAWFIDAVHVHEDSLSSGELTFGIPTEHNLNDQLFSYGVRINHNVIQDLQSSLIMVNIAPYGMTPNLKPAHWTYFPLLWPPLDNPITKGLNLVRSQYPGVIDTVGNNPEIKKTYILHTSDKAKVTSAPLLIGLSQIDDKITESNFNQSYLPVAVMLEGEFVSPFRNRMVGRYINDPSFIPKTKSEKTKMVIVSDGDIIRNEVSARGEPFPLGYDRYTKTTFGNKDFVKNIINYLTDEDGLMEIRNRTFQIRLLNRSKVAHNYTNIILMNTLLPVLMVLISGIVFIWIRQRKYSKS